MTNDTRHLLEAALRLPLRERAELMDGLRASFDDADFDPEFVKELERRADDAIAGRTRTSTWEEVQSRIRARLRRDRRPSGEAAGSSPEGGERAVPRSGTLDP